MSNVIYYFSGTGNSMKVARDIARNLKDSEVISIPEAINVGIKSNSERIGVVFPVYMWGLPLIVSEFIKKIKKFYGYLFAVATYGGMPGATLIHAANLLKLNGLKLSAGFAVQMPGNYTPMYGALSQSKQNSIFKKAEKKVNEISEIIKQKKENRIEKSSSIINWIFSEHFYPFASPRIPEMDKKFWADEKCTACGICVKVCPVSNISLVQGKPVWQHKCQQCLACLQWCPVEAIQYGKSTLGRQRYRHPEAKPQDFIHQS